VPPRMAAMNTLPALCALALLLGAGGPARAQDDRPRGGEPNVQRIVVEDDGTRIEELRVRGNTTNITVTPKGNAPAYEIITTDGSRDLSYGASNSRGAAGKRVWHVLSF